MSSPHSPVRRLPIPNVFSLRDLFTAPPDEPHPDKWGFPRGTALLITGVPGTGKAFFALSLVREQILALIDTQAGPRVREKTPSAADEASPSGNSAESPAADDDKANELLFVGIGIDEQTLAKRFGAFGWFVQDEQLLLKRPELKERFAFKIISVNETDLPQPIRGAEELINPILTKMRQHVNRPDAPARQNVFVVFDSLDSLVKGSQTAGDRHRNIQELVSLTKEHLGAKKALCVLLADSPGEGGQPDRETAAEFVFHLGFRDAGGGSLDRVLEVRKSPTHTPLLLGSHSWEILHPHNIRTVIAPAKLRDEIADGIRMGREPLLEKNSADWGKDRWGVVAILPHVQLPQIAPLQEWSTTSLSPTVDTAESISCGVPGLDEMLRGDQDYWAKPMRQLLSEEALPPASPEWRRKGGLFRGSTTFLVGRAGTGKSNCCIQFLLAQDRQIGDRENKREATGSKDDPSASGDQKPEDNTTLDQCLYINFENRPQQIRAWFPGDKKSKLLLQTCHKLYRRRSQLNMNLLIREIYWLVFEMGIERVAFDGLSDLADVVGPARFPLLVEELVAVVRMANMNAQTRHKDEQDALKKGLEKHENTRPSGPHSKKRQKKRNEAGKKDKSWPRLVSVFISLEADPDARVVTEYVQKDSPADNVIVFRQVTINDERRKTVEVRKARGQAPDRQIREMVIRQRTRRPLRVVPGLDNYRQVTEGQPEPVRFSLQLFGENPTEMRCNDRLTERLNLLFSYKVTPYGFSRGEIVRTLLDIANETDRIPFSDAKLFHIDEWWVRELRVKALRDSGAKLAETRHPLLRLNDFLAGDPMPAAPGTTVRHTPMPGDFWAVEIEKACVPLVTSQKCSRANADEHHAAPGDSPIGDRPNQVNFRADVVALPSYADYGIFCVNRLAVATGKGRELKWNEWLDLVPRSWAMTATVTGDGHPPLAWFAPPEENAPEDGRTVVDFMLKSVTPHEWATVPDSPIGFAFDMETPVTAGCAFLELCWAFGATEDFLVRDVVRKDAVDFPADHPMPRALGFLMYLVAEGLMPPRTTLKDVRRAVFSRHWYSSLPEVDPHADPAGPSAREPAGAEQKRPPGETAGRAARIDPEGAVAHRERTKHMFLRPLPFFPLGAFDAPPPSEIETPVLMCLQDAITRFDRLLKRIEAAILYRAPVPADPDTDTILATLRQARQMVENAAGVTVPPGQNGLPLWEQAEAWRRRMPSGSAPTEAVANQILTALEEAGEQVRDAVIGSRFFTLGQAYEQTLPDDRFDLKENPGGLGLHLPYAMFLDLRDVLELLRWHGFRLRTLRAALDGRSLGNVVREWTAHPNIGPPPGPPPAKTSSKSLQAISGFACEGSWMIGADRRTRSPNLSAKFLAEISSLASSEERAWLGAGIPARKDFYDLHGERPVPCLPHPELTWNKFLTYAGSRSRRRSRSFCARIRVSAAFDQIDQMIFHCLTLAGELREAYRAAGPGSDKRHQLVTQMTAAAAAAGRRLFEWIRAEMIGEQTHDRSPEACLPEAGQKPLASDTHCIICPFHDKCQALFPRPAQEGGAQCPSK